MTRKRKPTEKSIRSDFSYEYDFDSYSSQPKTAKAHKKQDRVKHADLAGLLDRLTVDELNEVLARQSSSPSERFNAMIEAIEQHLANAREQPTSNNAEKWASFNTPYGETKDDVLIFLMDFVRDSMPYEQQLLSARYIVKRLLKNVNSSTHTSAGFGLKLGAQVLFRESAWALVAVIPDIKDVLPKVSASTGGGSKPKSGSAGDASVGSVTSVPSAYIPTVVFIGAQLLANEEDSDARYAALSYGLEVLGYAALHNKETLAVEFLARAFARYQSKHGREVDPAYARLSTAVAERALHDLHKIQSTLAKDPSASANKNAPHHAICPYVVDMSEVILYMGLLSASPSRALGLFAKASSHTPSAANVLCRLTPAQLKAYDSMTQKTAAHLAKDLVEDLGKHHKGNKSKSGPAHVTYTTSVEDAILQYARDNNVDASKVGGSAASAGEKSNSKRGRDSHHSYNDGRRHRRSRGGCCSFLFKVLIFFAVVYFGLYVWRHHMHEPRRVANIFLKPYQGHIDKAVKAGGDAVKTATDFHKANIQPHIDTHVQPHIDTATDFLRPHYDTVVAAAQPHWDTAVAAAEPHWETAKVHATTLSEKAIAFFHAQVVPAYHHFMEAARVQFTLLGKKIDAMGHPWYDNLKPFYDTHVAPIWPKHVLPFYKEHVAPHYNAHVAPHVKTACDALTPHYNTAIAFVRPYWNILVEKFYALGDLIDEHGKLDRID